MIAAAMRQYNAGHDHKKSRRVTPAALSLSDPSGYAERFLL